MIQAVPAGKKTLYKAFPIRYFYDSAGWFLVNKNLCQLVVLVQLHIIELSMTWLISTLCQYWLCTYTIQIHHVFSMLVFGFFTNIYVYVKHLHIYIYIYNKLHATCSIMQYHDCQEQGYSNDEVSPQLSPGWVFHSEGIKPIREARMV